MSGKLTLSERICIEEGINQHLSFSQIARDLCISVSTVTREVKRNRTQESMKYLKQDRRNICMKREVCVELDVCDKGCLDRCVKCRKNLCNSRCPRFLPMPCPKTFKVPYVCNTCMNRYGFGCGFVYFFYDAHAAQEKANERRISSRGGIDCSEDELVAMTKTIRPLIKKGQSLEHIWAIHGDEFPVSARTYYRYIEMGIIDIINLDLPRRVRYKIRKKKPDPVVRMNLAGRTYEDFHNLDPEIQLSAVQMDCVIGKRNDKKALLTLMFPRYAFQIMILLPKKTNKEVVRALDFIEMLCGGSFSSHFKVLLTDRGTEFMNYEALERSITLKDSRCKVFYCDPLQSGQKGAAEKNHVELRRIIPKGISLDSFTPWDISTACSHINSYTRPALGGVAPYKLAAQVLPVDLLEGLGIEYISPDDVVMKPSLLQLV